MIMGRKPKYILELELPSKAYLWILTYKNAGITGYNIAKLVYGKEFYSPVKIYNVLKMLKKENLIFEKETIINGKKAKLIKPNLEKFFDKGYKGRELQQNGSGCYRGSVD